MSAEFKMYVGNLEYGVDDATLKEFLDSKGIQSQDVKVIKDKYTQKSKGFGFVEFDSEDALSKAIESLNGQDLNGRALKVSKARPPEQRSDNRERRPRF